MKKKLITALAVLFTVSAYAQGNIFQVGNNVGIGVTNPISKLHVNGATTTNLVAFYEGVTDLGYLGKGISITSGWNQYPEIFALTYQSRDFAIGGWSKTGKSWMGPSLFINSDNSNVGIGTTTPDAKLTVAGNINAREIKVLINAGADFVFHQDYKLPPLTELGTYVKTHQHLPGIASAEEMEKNGLEVGQMNIKLLQKIEELTLYMLEMKEQLDLVKQDNKELKAVINQLK